MGLFSSLFGPKPPKLYTGRILSAAEVRAQLGSMGMLAAMGKQRYAEVNSAAVIGLAQATRDALFAAGITKWRKTATCTVYAARFATLGQEKFFAASFQDAISAELVALAAGEVWFVPDSDLANGHAIGLCVTEKGLLTIDPQIPDALRPLSANETLLVRSVRLL